jgi:biopolymer transport protein ExbD
MLEQGVPINLPPAANSVEKPQSQEQTIIAISAQRLIYLNAKPVTEGELVTKVNEALEGKAARTVLIKADEEVDYGAVMAAMDQLRQAGIEDIGLITAPRNSQGGSTGAQ